MALGERMTLVPIALDVTHEAGLNTPHVVEQDFCVDPEHLIKLAFVVERGHCHIPEREHCTLLQFPGGARADHPEICQGPVIPEEDLILVFIKLGDPDAVFIRRGFFRHDIHANLRKIQVGADSDGRGDAGLFQDVSDHGDRHLVGRGDTGGLRIRFIEMQVSGHIDKALIDRIDMDVFGGDVLPVNLIDL